jgi:hypothetical protein
VSEYEHRPVASFEVLQASGREIDLLELAEQR